MPLAGPENLTDYIQMLGLWNSLINKPWFPNSLKNSVKDNTTGLHRHVLNVVQIVMENGPARKPASHVDVLVGHFLENGSSQIVPSPRYIASDVADHVWRR